MLANDSLRSLIAGMGDPSRDKLASTSYGASTLDDTQLLNAYQTSWMVRKAVDIPAQDATRKWRVWQGEASDVEAVAALEAELNIPQKVRQAKIQARLLGGAAIMLGDGSSDVSEPLDVERIARGGLKYVTVLPRRELAAGELNRDPASPTFGRPVAYDYASATSMLSIHPSRLCIFTGRDHADPWTAYGINYGWGESVVTAIYEAMRHGDSALSNVASLVFEANVDVIRVPGLMSLAADPQYEKKVLGRTALAAASKSINKTLLMDKDEEYERKPASFANLDKIMDQFLRVCAGAADIPMTRFMAQSPAGLSATGEGDMSNYHDAIASLQANELTPAMRSLDSALMQSALGTQPDGMKPLWSPLEQMSEKEQAEIGAKHAETASKLIMAGVFDATEMRDALTPVLTETGAFPNLAAIVAESGGDKPFDLGGDVGEIGNPDNEVGTVGGNRALALNGAQVSSMIEIVQSTAAKGMPEQTALALIEAAFPDVPREIINRIIVPLRSFVPQPVATPPPEPDNDDDT